MNFKFWKHNQTQAASKDRSARPKELSDPVGIYLITKLNEDPDWVWSLRSVERSREPNRQVRDIRIYDPRDAWNIHLEVKNYASLDNHPELVLYSGVIDKSTDVVQLEKPAQAA